MNDALLQQISTYAEDREIDYISAKVIGEQQGIQWKNEAQLVEFKQTIDMYLKTFDLEKFKLIEMKIETLSGKKARKPGEAEELTSYAGKVRSGGKDKKAPTKKKVNEAETYDLDNFDKKRLEKETKKARDAAVPATPEEKKQLNNNPRLISNWEMAKGRGESFARWKKRALGESKETAWSCKSKDGNVRVEESREGVFDVYKNGRKVDTLKNVTRNQVAQLMRRA